MYNNDPFNAYCNTSKQALFLKKIMQLSNHHAAGRCCLPGRQPVRSQELRLQRQAREDDPFPTFVSCDQEKERERGYEEGECPHKKGAKGGGAHSP